MILNDRMEEDLRTLKETDFMGPKTRAEFNKRQKAAGIRPTVDRKLRKSLLKKYDPSKLEFIRKMRKSEQLEIMRNMFG